LRNAARMGRRLRQMGWTVHLLIQLTFCRLDGDRWIRFFAQAVPTSKILMSS
jgi:hypothetical protein